MNYNIPFFNLKLDNISITIFLDLIHQIIYF
jgi:hypothetical protein